MARLLSGQLGASSHGLARSIVGCRAKLGFARPKVGSTRRKLGSARPEAPTFDTHAPEAKTVQPFGYAEAIDQSYARENIVFFQTARRSYPFENGPMLEQRVSL